MNEHSLWAALGCDAAQPLIAGILNLTPDSFSDGGRLGTAEAAALRGRELVAAGAQLVDVGGESTAPGRRPVSAEEELQRIEAAVASIAAELFVSIDTYHAETARRCLELGARMINDVSALRGDPELAAVLAEHQAYVVLMYNKQPEAPHADRLAKEYADVISEIGDFLAERVEAAARAGIREDRIVLDPGMGAFISPDPWYSFEVIARFEELVNRFPGIPFMISTSRKGFLGGKLEERDAVSQYAALLAVARGARVIRTHHPGQAAAFIEADRLVRAAAAGRR